LLKLLEQFNVTSLSGTTAFFQWHSLLLLYFGQINDYELPNRTG